MKLKTIYICENCGNNSQKWLGKCPECESWNSFQEEVIARNPKRTHSGIKQTPVPLHQTSAAEKRMPTNIGELDRVLGGGIVEGSVMLLSGEPGIGKSTLTLKICESIAQNARNVLYISGEESPQQISLRAKRLGVTSENLHILGESNLENILATLEAANPSFLVVDSIQVISSAEIPSLAGSINQVRFCAESLMNFAKQHNSPMLIIGHVTKEGNLAGPKILEHLVDSVLLVEGDRYQNLRVLRSLKNRYGSTNEVGLFDMTDVGLQEVTDASKLFLEERKEGAFGSAITTLVEGSRALMLEIQALTNTTPFGYPKRAASGYDLSRLQLLIAVIQKHLHVNLSNHDVYVNVVGGFKISDPSTDLAVIMAIISSLYQMPLPWDSVFTGEVGLSGELRRIPHLAKRIQEAEKLGFEKIYVPPVEEKGKKIATIPLNDINEAVKALHLSKTKKA